MSDLSNANFVKMHFELWHNVASTKMCTLGQNRTLVKFVTLDMHNARHCEAMQVDVMAGTVQR